MDPQRVMPCQLVPARVRPYRVHFPEPANPRNLFGFKDGTNNLKAEDTELLTEHVWAGEASRPEEAWMQGGSYLVARRIRMQIEIWDRTSLREQEQLIGRTKSEGAPLSGGKDSPPRTSPSRARTANP